MNADTISYAIDLGIGTTLVWLGLHYTSRTTFTTGIVIIGLAIAAQNARFAVDAATAIGGSIGRQSRRMSSWWKRRKTDKP